MSEPTSPSAAGMVKAGGTGTVIFGIVTMIFGILAMGAPLMAGLAVATVVAILMIAAGIARMFWAFKAESLGRGIFKFLVGGLTLVFGILILGRPLVGLGSLTLLLIAYFLVDGISEILAAFQVKPEPGWGWLLFGGIVSVLLALMLWRQFPLSGLWAPGILVGVRLLFSGMAMISVGAVARQVGKAATDAG